MMLIILDGFGLNPIEKGNPVFAIQTPIFDYLIQNSPHINLSASAESVGLSWGEVGNSEVGHSNLGTGQIIWQDLPRISETIALGSFFKNKVILETMRETKKNKSSLHLVGLISDGGIHSHLDHLFALLKIAKDEGLSDVFIHGFTDGRDTAAKCAQKYLTAIEKKMADLGLGKISTLSGRFYAMDRDNHWERIKKVYEAMRGRSPSVKKNPEEVIKESYKKGQDDETIEPQIVSQGNPKQFLRNKDSVIIFNFRADRAREITLALAKSKLNLNLATMTPYETDWKIKIKTIFGVLKYQSPLSDILAENNISQLHIAETEKYAHVTYFFNGGREKELNGEKHCCIPSPRVENYAVKPDMSLHQVVSQLLAEISKNDFQFVVANFANPDMVGHTGDYEATKKAIMAVDQNLEFLISKAKKIGFDIFITADHGNAEQMINLETGKIDKEHTTNPVFFLHVKGGLDNLVKFSDQEHKQIWSEISLDNPKGVLADITPTIASVLGIEGINYFSGQSLINLL